MPASFRLFIMENHNSKDNSKFKRILRPRWIWVVIVFGVFITLILIALPFGIDYGIERYFLANGADQAAVENIDFNLFTRRLVVKKLFVKRGKEEVLNVSDAGLTLAWSPFFKKRLLIKKIDLSDSQIMIEAGPDGRWRIGGLLPEPPADKSGGASWGFGLVELQVQNSLLKFRSPQLTSELKVERAHLKRLRTWLPDQYTRLEFTGRLNDGQLQLQGDFSPFGKDTTVDGSIKIQELTLTPFSQLIAAAPDALQGRLDADVRIQSQYGSEKGFTFDQKGRLNLKQARMRFEDVELADADLRWDGAVQINMPNHTPEALQITAAGVLEGQDGSVNPSPQTLAFRHSGLNWNGKFVLSQKPQTADITFEGQLKLREFNMADADLNLDEDNLTWNGSLKFILPENSENHRLITRGKLESGGQNITLLSQKLNLANGSLLWNGQFNCGLKDFSAGLAAEGDFSLTDLALTATHTKLRLLASKAVDLKSIRGDADMQFSIAAAKITGLDLIGETGSPENASLFSASEVTLDNVILERLKQVSIESARLVAAKAVLHHQNDGRWLYLDDLTTFLADSGSSSQRKPSPNRVAEENRPPAKEADVQSGIRIGSLEIAGDSVLHFKDETVSPTFNTDLGLTAARLTGVNSFEPEQSSPFTIEALSRKYTRLKLQGDVQPFRERFSMDLKAKIRAAEMPPLSPYAVKTLGYNLISGEMDADIDLKITAGKMGGEGDLKFHKPEIEAVDPEKFKNEQGQSLPLQSALTVLRDKDNDVRLKIPISGDVTDPRFNFSDAINQALIKGLSMTTLSYLKYMLGPYGMAIGVIELGVKVGTKVLPGIRLKPVEFQPGASELDPAAMEYLDKVAAILKEKKDLRLRLCGWAIENDRVGRKEATPKATAPSGSKPLATKSAPGGEIDAQKEPRFPLTDEAMLQLAEQRADRIEDILVSRHGIKNKRIFICQPEIDKSPAAQPRVELVF